MTDNQRNTPCSGKRIPYIVSYIFIDGILMLTIFGKLLLHETHKQTKTNKNKAATPIVVRTLPPETLPSLFTSTTLWFSV